MIQKNFHIFLKKTYLTGSTRLQHFTTEIILRLYYSQKSQCFKKVREYQIRKQLFADVHQNSVLKNLTNFTGKHLCWSVF